MLRIEPRRPLARLRDAALDLLFTPRCVGCGGEGGYLCERCLRQARPLEAPYLLGNPGGAGLDTCLVAPVAVDGVLSCFAMEGAVREAVHHLKYRGLRAIAPALGGLLARRARSSGLSADGIVPVPLHPRRLRERGYNQASLLAAHAARELALPLDAEALQRVRHSPPQARSGSIQERHAAVRDAFQARRRLDGRRLFLVDDVCTTGATLDACAHALKAAGASAVWGLTLAREV